MASAADDIDLPSLSSPVLACGNDGQRYRDGQNRTLAAAATGKHRQNASTNCRVLTWLINNKKITSSSFNDIDLLHIMLIDCCVRRRRGRGTMAAVGRRRPPWSGCVLFH